jgi:hypothetical protein
MQPDRQINSNLAMPGYVIISPTQDQPGSCQLSTNPGIPGGGERCFQQEQDLNADRTPAISAQLGM